MDVTKYTRADLTYAQDAAYNRVCRDLDQVMKALDAKALRNDVALQTYAAFAIDLVKQVRDSYVTTV